MEITTGEELIKCIKLRRQAIDCLYRLTKDNLVLVHNEIKTKEILKVEECLLLAKAWYGKALERIGTINPYAKADGNRHEVKDIEPTADKVEFDDTSINPFDGKNYIERIDWLREDIKAEIIRIPDCEEFRDNYYDKTMEEVVNKVEDKKEKKELEQRLLDELPDYSVEQHYVVQYLTEARFWLGFELGRIKEQSEQIVKN